MPFRRLGCDSAAPVLEASRTMVSLGLNDDVIIEKIHTTSITSFDTSIDALKTLKEAILGL